MRRHIPQLCIVVVTGVALWLPFALKGLPQGHDASSHSLWAQQFVKGFLAGDLAPRWPMDVNAGYGSTAFIFYPPLTFYTYALMGLLVRDVPSMIVGSALAALLASGLAMYVLCRQLAGPWGACLGAVVYMAAPYHLLDLYQRTAMAEHWAFAWFPLILYAARRLERPAPLPLALLALGSAGLILTHVVSILLFFPFLLFFIVALWWQERDGANLATRIAALGLGCSLASFFLLPMLSEYKLANLVATDVIFPFSDHFLFHDLSNDAWIRSVTMMALALCPALVVLLAAHTTGERLKNALSRDPALVGAVIGILAFLLMTPSLRPLWDLLPVFKKIQFAWRLLTVMSLFGALSIAVLAARIASTGASRLRWPLAILLVLSVLANGALSLGILRSYEGFRPSPSFELRPGTPYPVLRDSMFAYQDLRPHVNDQAEYLPVWAARRMQNVFDPPYRPLTGSEEDLVTFRGKGSARVISWEPETRVVEVEAPKGGALLLRTFYYPWWRARTRDVELDVSASDEDGALVIDVPSGSHRIAIWFDGGPWYLVGRIVSLAGLVGLAAVCIVLRRRKRT